MVSGGHTEGLVTLGNVRSIPHDARKTTLVREAMTPLNQVKSVSPNEDLANILRILSENDINQVPVVWENTVVGIVARDNLINFINTRMNFSVAEYRLILRKYPTVYLLL